MTPTHTPGPWTAAEQFDGEDSLGIAISAGRQEIVRIHDIGREGFANAAVIAAAPDLLAALTAVMNELIDSDFSEDFAETIETASVAIARATGVSS